MRQATLGQSSTYLNESIGLMDALLHPVPTVSVERRVTPQIRPMGIDVARLSARVEEQLRRRLATQERLVQAVRSVRRELGGTTVSARHDGLSEAPLEVPHRITKRNYNYFDDLNAALAAL